MIEKEVYDELNIFGAEEIDYLDENHPPPPPEESVWSRMFGPCCGQKVNDNVGTKAYKVWY